MHTRLDGVSARGAGVSLFASIAIAAAAIVAVYAILAQQVSAHTLLKRTKCCLLDSLTHSAVGSERRGAGSRPLRVVRRYFVRRQR